MNIFVAGATGAIGRPLLPILLRDGHSVTAMTRSPEKAAALKAAGARVAIADALDRKATRRAVDRAAPDIVIHQLTALSTFSSLRQFARQFAETNRLRTTGTRNLLDAARAAGVRRFIAQSYTGWPNARTGGPIKTEDDPLDAEPPAPFRSTLEAIQYVEREVLNAGLEGIVLRYGGFYGPGTSLAPSAAYLEAVRKRRFPIVGSGNGYWSFIHIEDAAAATAAAVEHAAPGIYNIVDDEPAPVAVWLPYLAAAIGAPPPRHVPAWLGRLFIGKAGVTMMTEMRGASNAKAKRELGWQPRYASWRDGFRRLAA